jgi:hypothetical protein
MQARTRRLVAVSLWLVAGATAVTPTVASAQVARKLVPGSIVSFRALANGRYVVAENAGAAALIANRTAIGLWERFAVVDAGGGNIALRALVNERYVAAESAGASALIANRTAIGPWETFTEVDAGNGAVALRASANGRYVCAENAGAASLIANRTAVASWESFTVVTSSPPPTPTPTPRPVATSTPTPTPAGRSSDVVGKITVGYQAWFAAIGDGSPINGWWHWSQNWSQTPSIAQNTIHAWPDTREYPNLYGTSYPNLGNGQAARLFSSFDQSTINVQVGWMRQYGIDTAALQRFNPTGGEGPIRDAITAKVGNAAEGNGVKFYIMYDVSGWTNMQSEIKNDWLSKMSAYTTSPAYARHDGKPVVAIWGFGFNDNNHPWSAAVCLDVINWFKAQGVYIIGGVPTNWRNSTDDSRPSFQSAYYAFDMISPWMVGRIGTIADVDRRFNDLQVQDQADLNARGIAYQPCVLPGDTRQRAHGDFMWRQFYNMVRLGAQGIYISMYDEYNEGNQIAKTAEDASMSPMGTSDIFFTLDQDGVRCSSDYYLRLTRDGGRMLKGQIPLTATRPTSPQ